MAIEKFTKDHEYIRIDGDVGIVGITNHAQEQLGDVVFVEVPDVGRNLKQGEQAAIVESVKAASEIYAPVSGEVVDVNQGLSGNPALVNQDPMGAAWFMKIRLSNVKELDGLMDRAAYDKFVAESH
jgi:glycine cleavage system H protein